MKVDKEHGEFHALDVDEGWRARRRDRDLFDEDTVRTILAPPTSTP